MKKNETIKDLLSTAKKRLSDARITSADLTIQEQRRDFIDRFTLCDVTCKAVLETHEMANGTNNSESKIYLDMRRIPSAMNYVGLSISKLGLNGIFGGSGQYNKRGKKSAKKLRDGIVHAMNKEVINEVVERYADLRGLMDGFLNFFS